MTKQKDIPTMSKSIIFRPIVSSYTYPEEVLVRGPAADRDRGFHYELATLEVRTASRRWVSTASGQTLLFEPTEYAELTSNAKNR
jgi:hypothetical protein